MKSKAIYCIWIVLAALWIGLLARGAGRLPPLMRILDLYAGVWSHQPSQLGDSQLPGLKEPVHITWDKAGVPHFFASNEADLYRAQGFVMASQRLFQMDLVTRQAAGRLSEWVGDMTMDYDRFNVRLGMRESARRTHEKFAQDPHTKMAMQSFAEGINAYIDVMPRAPVEYLILGARPERFSAERLVYMDKSLTFNLAGRSFAPVLSALQQQLGTDKVLDLFPEFLPPEYEDYIVPDNPKALRRAPETAALFGFKTGLKSIPAFPLANPSNGSNNWAVGPAKSKTGHSIVANDTHLNYSLPNIWYENQLSTPEFNVYGVALVALPGIINGYNSKIAWGPTNGTTTVLDWFEIEFENETSLRYKYKGEWIEPDLVQEETIVKAGAEPEKIQVVWTKLGTLMHREGRLGLTALWMGHRTEQEFKALRGLYTAGTYEECRKSFTSWAVPIQNFICADAKTVSIRHTGFLPKRQVGEGRFIMDGRNTAPTMTEAVPETLHPQVVGAPYVHSANQKVVGPHYPFYLGWDYEDPYRGIMIRRRLEAADKFTPEDIMRMQNDSYDLQAAMALPLLLKNLKEEGLSEAQRAAVQKLREWIYDATAAKTEPALFKAWFWALRSEVFEGTYQIASWKPLNVKSMRVAWLLKRLDANPQDSDAQWLKAPLPEVVTRAFTRAWEQLAAQFGADPAKWTWTAYNRTQLPHVARLPGFGSKVLPMDGSGQALRGNHGNHGPVYKAVFELGDAPKAWMQVPGGNNGDPLSPEFERFVEEWAAGEMREVEFYKDLDEAKSKAVSTTVLRPGS